MNEIKVIAPYYSGEFTMGTVTDEFVRYWSDKDESDLLEYLHEVNWSGEVESDSPTETGADDRTPFYEIDDIEHFNMPYVESIFSYVSNDGDEADFKPYACHVRHIDSVSDSNLSANGHEEEFIPVLVYASTEKGYCGHWIVELKNEDFDRNKFVISTVQTLFGRFVDSAWYGNSDEELYFDASEAGTLTKATSARVGWMHRNWLQRSRSNSLDKILDAKNKHVNLEQGSIQGFDISKYL